MEEDFDAQLARRARRQSYGGDEGPETTREYSAALIKQATEVLDHPPSAAVDYTELGLYPPRDLDGLGVPNSLVHDLALRRALFEGRTSTLRLAESLSLSPQMMNRVVEEMREMRYLEVQGLDGRDYVLALTDYGREQANERMRLSRYAGAVPVSLGDYTRVVWAQQTHVKISRDVMKDAFSDLVVNDRLLDELGPALLTRGAMFLYGPPGTGKTSIAERLNRIHHDVIVVPRAVEVDSQLITVFDPVIHEPVDPQPSDLDPRWVLCKRPSIIAGGELTKDMLDLQYEAANGVYLAPLQMQANNGVLIIDDFGRQVMHPSELLNRWIVPLDRRVDYLSLSYGVKFEVPFDVKVVLSTNLNPVTLGDEAFFRRIQNKIFIKPIYDAEFDEVLFRAAEHHAVKIDDDAPSYLRIVSRELGDGDLRPYLPHEVCKLLKAVCEYEDEPLVLNRKNIDSIAAIYFTQPQGGAGTRWQSEGLGAAPTAVAPATAGAGGNGGTGGADGQGGASPDDGSKSSLFSYD